MGQNYFDQFDTIPAEPIAGEAEAPGLPAWGTAEPWTFLDWEKSAQQELRPPGVTEVAPPSELPALPAKSGVNFFDQFDAPPPRLPLPDWMTNPAPASWGDAMQILGIGSAQNDVQPASGGPASGIASVRLAPPPSPAIPPASPPPAPRVLDSRLILGMKNAFGGNYDQTRQWFADNGYGNLLQSNSPSQPSMFDRYWSMLDEYDRDKQQADDARKVGFGEAFAREGLRGLAGITEYENRLLSPAYWGLDATSRALTGYDPNLSAIPDAEAEQRNSLAIQPYEELTIPGQIGAGFGGALPMVMTAPIAGAALPEEALTTAPDVAPTLWNTTKAVAARIPRGISAMMPAAALAAQDTADQGGSTADQLKAASLTVAMGAVPMLAESGASSLPLRIAERGAKSGALAIPASALISNLQNPSRRTTAGFTADDVISAIPQIITGALTGGRELPFRGTVGGRPSVVNPALRNTNASAAGDAFLDRMRAALDRDAARRANNVTPPGAESSPANPYRNANGSLRIPERASSRTDPNLASYEAKMKRIADDAQLADAAYDRVPDTFGGKVIGTDLARELLDEYAAGRDGRIKYVNATGRVAQAYAKDRLWREITHPGGRDLLTFTAGGVAAGKSTALTKATVGNADLVFDGTLRETKWAIDTIELARANGWKVEIYYVQRPMPLVIQGAIDRAQREGRWGAIADLPKIHRAAQESILKIADALKSDPGVQIQYWLNAGTPEYPMPAKAIDRAEIDPEGEYSYAEITDDQGRANRTSTPKNAQRVQRGFPAYWQGEVERAVESERVESPEAGQAYPGSFSAYWQREVEQAFRRAVESGKYDPEILAGLAQGSPELESILHSAREVPGGLDRMRAALDADAAREEKSVHASGAGSSSSDDGIASGTAIGDLVHFEPIPSHELPLAEALRIEALARAVRKSKENSGNDPAGERIVFQANRALGDRFRGGRGAAALRFIEDFGRLTGTRVVFVDSNEGTPFFSGAVDPRDPNAIFIHVRGKRPIDALLGHEWGHTLQRQDPALYRSLQRIAFRYTGDWRLRARTFRAGATYRTPKQWGVELTNNYLGDAFMDPDFWREVHSHVDSSLFHRAYRSVLDWLDELMAKARAGFGTAEFATNLAALRREFAKMVAEAIRRSPYRNGALLSRLDLDRMAATLDGDAEVHFARVGQTLREADRTMVEDAPETPLLDTRASNEKIATEAAKIVSSWPDTIKTADGSTIKMFVADRGSMAARVFHLIRDANTKAIHLTKAAWLPRVGETLRNAQVRLIDAQEGTRIYVRKYRGGVNHAVVIRPDGTVESQKTFTGSLTTQFPIQSIWDPRTRQKYMEVDWVRPDITN